MQFCCFKSARFKLDEGRDSVDQDRREQQRSGNLNQLPAGRKQRRGGKGGTLQTPACCCFHVYPTCPCCCCCCCCCCEPSFITGLVGGPFRPASLQDASRTDDSRSAFLPRTRYQGGSSLGEIYGEQAVHQTRQGQFLRPCNPQITQRCCDKRAAPPGSSPKRSALTSWRWKRRSVATGAPLFTQSCWMGARCISATLREERSLQPN